MAGLKYPFTGFHFIVFFEGLPGLGPQDFRFQEVSGITYSLGGSKEKVAASNDLEFNFPEPSSYETLTLKRGLFSGSRISKWVADAIEDFKIKPVTVNIFLLNELHMPQEGWRFFNAYPCRWSINGFDAMDDKILVESIDLKYTSFRRISPLSGIS
jgi:phage tail-like protein